MLTMGSTSIQLSQGGASVISAPPQLGQNLCVSTECKLGVHDDNLQTSLENPYSITTATWGLFKFWPRTITLVIFDLVFLHVLNDWPMMLK